MNQCECETSPYSIGEGWIDWRHFAKNPTQTSTIQIAVRCSCNQPKRAQEIVLQLAPP